jgi:hypothetical protein
VGQRPRTVGGEEPEAIALVWSSNGSRGETSPLRIEPHRVKVAEDASEPTASQVGGVFGEDERRLNLGDDPPVLAPESGLVPVDARFAARGADVLARESAGDDVDASAPRSPVEGAESSDDAEVELLELPADVIVDLDLGPSAVVSASGKHSTAVGVNLDGADGAPPEDRAAVQSSASPGKKSELIHSSPIAGSGRPGASPSR